MDDTRPDFRIVERQKEILHDLQQAFTAPRAQAWADSMLHTLTLSAEVIERSRRQWSAERKWLIESMTADGIPDYIQALVLERWDK